LETFGNLQNLFEGFCKAPFFSEHDILLLSVSKKKARDCKPNNLRKQTAIEITFSPLRSQDWGTQSHTRKKIFDWVGVGVDEKKEKTPTPTHLIFTKDNDLSRILF
jgi:hypothetical protein